MYFIVYVRFVRMLKIRLL